MFGNIFNSLQFPEDKPKEEEEKQTTGLMSSPRPRARPEGMTTSLRPRARPIDDGDDDNTINKTLANTIREINNPAYDDEDGVVASPPGTPLNSVDAQQVLLNPDSLHSTYNTRMAQAGADFTVKQKKYKSNIADTLLYDVRVMQANLARPENMTPAQIEQAALKQVSGSGPELSTLEIQTELKSRGIDPGPLDGKMGPKTRTAIKRFQEIRGIEDEDGAGSQTQTALRSLSPITEETLDKELEPASERRQRFAEALSRRPGIRTLDPFEGAIIDYKEQYEKDSLEAKTILEQADPETAPETAPEDRGLGAPTPTSVITATDRRTKQGRMKIQQALKDLNYDVGEVDGDIGPQTAAAIRQFQKDNNLGQDAVVGRNTSIALNEALKSAPKETQEVTKQGFLKRFKDFIVSKITPKEVQQVEKLIEQGFNPIDITINYPLVTGETGLLGKGTRGKYITLSDNMETGPESEAFRDTIVKILEDAGAASGIDAKGNVVAWCAAFVDAILHEGDVSRLKGNRLGALAYENYGVPVDSVDAAKQGDIVVIHSRNVAIDRVTKKVVFDSIPYNVTDSKYHQQPDKYEIVPGYHVGFYVGEGRADNTFQLLGGNQSNTVSIKSFDMGKIHKIRRLKPEDLNKAIIK